MANKPIPSYYSPKARFMLSPRSLSQSETKTTSYRIRTPFTDSISHNNNQNAKWDSKGQHLRPKFDLYSVFIVKKV